MSLVGVGKGERKEIRLWGQEQRLIRTEIPNWNFWKFHVPPGVNVLLTLSYGVFIKFYIAYKCSQTSAFLLQRSLKRKKRAQTISCK